MTNKINKLYQLGDYLNAINYTKKDLMDTYDEGWKKKYPAYIINRCLSMFWDTIESASHMNSFHFLDNDVQFQFLINSVRKKRRFGGKWLKQSELENLQYVKEYFGYGNEKAREALNILTEKQIEDIKEALNKGGRKK